MKTACIAFASAMILLPCTAQADYFINQCGGTRVKAISLTQACKKNLGKTIVKCQKKCAKKKKLKCIKHVWKLKKSKSCGVNTGSKSNSMKTRRCSASQIATLKSDYSNARTRAYRIRSGVEAALRKKHSKDTTRQLKRVKRWVNKIINKLNQKVRFTCRGTQGLCKTANAHTAALVGNGLRICKGYFSCSGQDYRAAVIVHELAHKAGANDAVYFSSCGTGPGKTFPKSLKTWSRTADSYEYWARFGFCIPGDTCPK